jgi:hypothetical protein
LHCRYNKQYFNQQNFTPIIDEDNCESTGPNFTLKPGSETYSFMLTMPGESLPSPFRNQYGQLRYKISAYLRSRFSYVLGREVSLKFRGHNDLSHFQGVIHQLHHDSGFRASFLSSKKSIAASFDVEKADFLPGEYIPFKIKVVNPKSFVIRSLNVMFFRRTTYNIDGAVKSTNLILNTCDRNEFTRNNECIWTDKILVPKDCMVNYNAESYQVNHILEVGPYLEFCQ